MLRTTALVTLLAALTWGCSAASVEPPGSGAGDPGHAAGTGGGSDGLAPIEDRPAVGAEDPRFAELTKVIEAERVESEVPGVAVVVVDKGKVVFARGFGVTAPGGDQPVKATTVFGLGSVTKCLTAVATLREVAAGRVSLDAPVVKYRPDFELPQSPNAVSEITVRHLLTQSSTLQDANGNSFYREADDFMASYVTHGYTMARPGSFHSYSNPNFVLAGAVVESTSGKTYGDYMTSEVLAPLGMTRTFFDRAAMKKDGDYALGDDGELATPGPAAGATSSVFDMARFAGFLMHGNDKVLPAKLRQEMTSLQVRDDSVPPNASYSYGYGYGLFVEKGLYVDDGEHFLPGVERVNHGGDVPGVGATLSMFPKSDVVFIALGSKFGVHFPRSETAALRAVAELPAPTTPPSLGPSPAKLDRLVGVYDDPHFGGRITVERSATEGHISVFLQTLDNYFIPYRSDVVMFTDTSGELDLFPLIGGPVMPLVFHPGPDGTITHVSTRSFAGTRSDPDAAGPAVPGLTAVRNQLDQFRDQ